VRCCCFAKHDILTPSSSFAHRVVKYCSRGSRVVFPGASPHCLNSQGNTLDFLDITVTKRGDGRLSLRLPRGEVSDYQSEYDPDDYRASEVVAYPRRFIERQNYWAAVRNRPELIVSYVEQPGSDKTTSEATSSDCRVPTRNVKSIAQGFHKSSAENPRAGDDLLMRFGRAEVAEEYILAQLRGDSARCKQIEDDTIARVTTMLEDQEVRLQGDPRWRTENPGAQWTTSINPVKDNPRDYYGSAYRPFRVMVNDSVYVLLRLLARENPHFGRLPREILGIVAHHLMDSLYEDIFENGWDSSEIEHSGKQTQLFFVLCSGCGETHLQVVNQSADGGEF
jgi:hypothetical protein